MIYWISTALVSLFLLLSATSYLFHQATIEGVSDLGFPDFFRVQLAILKLVAVLILLIPSVPIQVKEWAYSGVGLFLITAIVAHIAHKDSYLITIVNVALLAVLVTSNVFLKKHLGLD